MEQYLNTMQEVLDNGTLYPDRTGTGRVRIFGAMETYDLAEGIPLVTTRQIFLKNLVKELLGFIAGGTTVAELGESFWGKWAVSEADVEKEMKQLHKEAEDNNDEYMKGLLSSEVNLTGFRNHLKGHIGSIGPMYGYLWRNFPRVTSNLLGWVTSVNDIPSDKQQKIKEDFLRTVALSNGEVKNTEENWVKFAVNAYSKTLDQLNMVLLGLKRNPYSSRHRVTAYHPDLAAVESMTPQQNVFAGRGALAACHSYFQFMVTDGPEIQNGEGETGRLKVLNCMFYMSSSDVALGRPYNIAQYALLTYMFAHCLDYIPGKLSIVSCDTHLYADHLETAEVQVKRTPLKLAKLVLPQDKKDLFAFTPEDFVFEDYQHCGKLDYKASV